MICDFLASFSSREEKRATPTRNRAPKPRPHREDDPLTAPLDFKGKRGVSE